MQQDQDARRALEAHTERAIGRAVLAAAQGPFVGVVGADPTAARTAIDADSDLIRERDNARAALGLSTKDLVTTRAGAEQLKLAAEAAERAAKGAREARDASECKLRDVTRDLENEKRLRAEDQHALAELRKACTRQDDTHDSLARDLAKAKQQVSAANEELNRLRLAGRRVDSPT